MLDDPDISKPSSSGSSDTLMIVSLPTPPYRTGVLQNVLLHCMPHSTSIASDAPKSFAAPAAVGAHLEAPVPRLLRRPRAAVGPVRGLVLPSPRVVVALALLADAEAFPAGRRAIEEAPVVITARVGVEAQPRAVVDLTTRRRRVPVQVVFHAGGARWHSRVSADARGGEEQAGGARHDMRRRVTPIYDDASRRASVGSKQVKV